MEYLAILFNFITCCLKPLELVLNYCEYRRGQQIHWVRDQEHDTGLVDYFLMETLTVRSWVYVNHQFTNFQIGDLIITHTLDYFLGLIRPYKLKWGYLY